MIPFSKPEIELSNKDLKDIGLIIKSGRLCKGKHTEELENYFKNEYGVTYAKVCCNATNGLLISMLATNLKDKFVAIPTFTWPSTLYAILHSGNTPVWFDIDMETWNLLVDKPKATDPALSMYCTKHMRYEHPDKDKVLIDCVIPVDIFGNISYIKVPSSVRIIYDAAHSFGNKYVGNRGNAEVISFSFTKPITAGGQGGVILTNDETMFESINEMVDLSAKMGEVNAYIALKCIDKYKEKQKKRLEIIDMYRDFIKVPVVEQKIEYVTNYSVYSVLFESNEKRDKVVKTFKENGIEVKCYYEPLVFGFKNSDDIYSRILSLPVYTSVEKNIKHICNLINEA